VASNKPSPLYSSAELDSIAGSLVDVVVIL
jgi:hypothetical protein